MENKNFESIKITVIVPSFNQGPYIENCIKSIIKQTYNNWELIIQDGNSTDNTKAICTSYVNSDTRIFFYSEKDNGYADAVNKALDKATGTLVVIQSSDDFFAYNNVFKDVVKHYHNNPNLIIISGSSIIVDVDLNLLATQEKVDKYVPLENIYILKDHFSQGATFFELNRSIYIGKLDPKVDMVADTDFWVRLATYKPVSINTILLSSQIWGGVTVQAEQRSSNLSQFYLGRAKMAYNHFLDDNIQLSSTFKKAHANNLILKGISHFKLLKKDYKEFLWLYKSLNGVEYLDNKTHGIRDRIKMTLGLGKKKTINSKDEMYNNKSKNPNINFRWFD
jgi:glycosyltransferase involved in cell wall biosynthesis